MNGIQHKKACLRRHYENMTKERAYKVMSELNKSAKRIFKKRVNHAKGYEFLKQ